MILISAVNDKNPEKKVTVTQYSIPKIKSVWLQTEIGFSVFGGIFFSSHINIVIGFREYDVKILTVNTPVIIYIDNFESYVK